MTVEPVGLTPHRNQIDNFLRAITRRWPELTVEVDFEIRPLGGGGVRSRRFGLHNIDAAVPFAAAANEDGLNAYAVINPIRRTHTGSANAEAIVGAIYIF